MVSLRLKLIYFTIFQNYKHKELVIFLFYKKCHLIFNTVIDIHIKDKSRI